MTTGNGMPFALFAAIGLLVSVAVASAQSTQMGTSTQVGTSNKTLNQRNAVGLNPQPEPPSAKGVKKVKPVEMRGLNPQPEPPKPPSLR